MDLRPFIVVAATLLAAGGNAVAQKKCPSAIGREHWASGEKAYNLGEYDKAAEHWKKAYETCADPELLFNLAQAHRKLKQHARARDLFKSWLRESPNADPAERADVERKIADLEKLIEAEKASAESPPTGTNAPPPGPVEPAPATPTEEAQPWYRDTVGWSLVAGGVVVMGVGGGLFVYGGSLRDDADAAMDQGEAASLVDDAGTYRTTGAVMLGVGAAIAVAGGIKLALTDAPASQDSTNVAFGPGWVVLHGSF